MNSVAIALGVAAVGPAAAQAGGVTGCFESALDSASLDACERTGGARREIATVSPWRAYELKEVHGRRVLLLDVRSVAEVALVGAPDMVDAVVPLAELAQPLQADPARGDLRLVPNAHFDVVARAWVAVLGGDDQTPLLILCRTGERARQAAHRLRAAGFTDVSVIDGGFEGALGRDGRRHGGWKDAGLPWTARVEPRVLFGEPD